MMIFRPTCRSLLFTLCVFLYFALPEIAGATVLKIATLSPDGTTWMKQMRSAGEEIAKRTDGRVRFKFYPGGIMGNDESVLRKIRVGQLHGGAVISGALAKIYPDIQIYSLPFLFRSFEEVDYVRGYMDRQLVSGLEKNGFVTFGFAEGGFGYLMSQEPVTSISALKTQRVWLQTGDEISRVMLEEAGVSPVSLPISDVLTSLQTGLINTVVTSPIGAIALQWHTKIRYLTHTPLAYVYALLAVDRKAFLRISESDRDITHEVMEKTFDEINRRNRIDDKGAMLALQKQDIEMLQPAARELDTWKSIAAAAQQKLADRGLFSPATLKQVQEYLYAYRSNQAVGGE